MRERFMTALTTWLVLVAFVTTLPGPAYALRGAEPAQSGAEEQLDAALRDGAPAGAEEQPAWVKTVRQLLSAAGTYPGALPGRVEIEQALATGEPDQVRQAVKAAQAALAQQSMSGYPKANLENLLGMMARQVPTAGMEERRTTLGRSRRGIGVGYNPGSLGWRSGQEATVAVGRLVSTGRVDVNALREGMYVSLIDPSGGAGDSSGAVQTRRFYQVDALETSVEGTVLQAQLHPVNEHGDPVQGDPVQGIQATWWTQRQLRDAVPQELRLAGLEQATAAEPVEAVSPVERLVFPVTADELQTRLEGGIYVRSAPTDVVSGFLLEGDGLVFARVFATLAAAGQAIHFAGVATEDQAKALTRGLPEPAQRLLRARMAADRPQAERLLADQVEVPLSLIRVIEVTKRRSDLEAQLLQYAGAIGVEFASPESKQRALDLLRWL